MCGTNTGLDELIDLLIGSEVLRAGAYCVHAERRGRDGCGDVARPLAVGGKSRVGVGFRDEGTARSLRHAPLLGRDAAVALSAPVLGTIGHGSAGVRIEICQGRQEAITLAGKDVLIGGDIEDPGHEVLGCGVLFEATHEIGNGHVELAGIDDGNVQQE